MHKSNKSSYINLKILLLDFAGILFSFYAAYFLTKLTTFLYAWDEYIGLLIVYVPIFVLAMSVLGMYHKLTFNYYDRIIWSVLKACFISALVVASVIFYTKNYEYSRLFYIAFMTLACLSTTVLRITYFYFTQKKKNYSFAKNVIIVGTQSAINKFEYYLNKTHVTMKIIGYIEAFPDNPLEQKPYLGTICDLEKILKTEIIDEVIFAVELKHITEMEESVKVCEHMGVTARIVLSAFNLNVSRVHFTGLGTMPMLTLHTVNLNDIELLMKRMIDIAGAIIGLCITAVISCFIIPIMKKDSPGPVLFAQERMGANGRVFNILKFRTMHVDAEQRKQELMKQNKIEGGFMFKIEDDPRITWFGRFLRKTSLDELPQFINVLKGEMSLVGTRPPTPDEVKRYKTHHYRRISFKPGLTGMWQTAGRSELIDFDEVVKLDTQYIDQWSVWLDLRIIFKTIIVVFAKKGAY